MRLNRAKMHKADRYMTVIETLDKAKKEEMMSC